MSYADLILRIDERNVAANPAFRQWFAGSKAVDHAGHPLVVYHGTTADIDEFQTFGNGGKTHGTGLFMSSDPRTASTYTRNIGGTVYPVYVNLKNPMVVQANGANWNQLGDDVVVELPDGTQDRLLDYFGIPYGGSDETASTDDVARLARQRGHDGVIVYNVVDRGPNGSFASGVGHSDLYVAFSPNQIKSALNRGTFDSNSPKIAEDMDNRNFRYWFGRSVVVDDSGKPLVVYHGTRSDITAFDRTKTVDGGFHFGTAEQANTRAYADGKNIIPVYLSIQNPRRSKDMGGNWAAKIASAKSARHDGIVYLNRYEGIPREEFDNARERGIDLDRISDAQFRKLMPSARDSYIAFRPDQIKSVFNTGSFDSRNPNISESIVNELARPSMDSANAILYKAGYKLLGKGAYGRVYERPDERYVLKLFHNEDVAYRAFLAMILQTQNPHFPKIIGRPIRVNNEYSAVRMEKLSPYRGDPEAFKTYVEFRDYSFSDLNGYYANKYGDAVELFEFYPHLKAALDAICNLVRGSNAAIKADMGNPANYMMRGDTVVFTDPVSPNVHPDEGEPS